MAGALSSLAYEADELGIDPDEYSDVVESYGRQGAGLREASTVPVTGAIATLDQRNAGLPTDILDQFRARWSPQYEAALANVAKARAQMNQFYQTRQADTQTPWLHFASGMLKPTRTGQFGESFGEGLGQYAGALDKAKATDLALRQRSADVGYSSARDQYSEVSDLEKRELEAMKTYAALERARRLGATQGKTAFQRDAEYVSGADIPMDDPDRARKIAERQAARVWKFGTSAEKNARAILDPSDPVTGQVMALMQDQKLMRSVFPHVMKMTPQSAYEKMNPEEGYAAWQRDLERNTVKIMRDFAVSGKLPEGVQDPRKDSTSAAGVQLRPQQPQQPQQQQPARQALPPSVPPSDAAAYQAAQAGGTGTVNRQVTPQEMARMQQMPAEQPGPQVPPQGMAPQGAPPQVGPQGPMPAQLRPQAAPQRYNPAASAEALSDRLINDTIEGLRQKTHSGPQIKDPEGEQLNLEIQKRAMQGANKYFDETVMPAADASRGVEMNAKIVMNLLQKYPDLTGAGKDVLGAALNWADTFGFATPGMKSRAKDWATFNSIVMNEVLMQQLAQKGPQTESDAKRMMQARLMITNPAESNKFIARLMMATAKRAQEQAKFFAKYRKQSPSLIGAQDAWNQYTVERPIVSIIGNEPYFHHELDAFEEKNGRPIPRS